MKNLASMGLVSTTVLMPLLETLFRCGMQKLVDDCATSLHGKQKVLLDGDWVGVCEDSALFVSKLRRKRRRNEVPHQVGYDHFHLILYIRIMKPCCIFWWDKVDYLFIYKYGY